MSETRGYVALSGKRAHHRFGKVNENTRTPTEKKRALVKKKAYKTSRSREDRTRDVSSLFWRFTTRTFFMIVERPMTTFETGRDFILARRRRRRLYSNVTRCFRFLFLSLSGKFKKFRVSCERDGFLIQKKEKKKEGVFFCTKKT